LVARSKRYGQSRQAGSSLLEMAVVFPLLTLCLLAIGAASWTFWLQAAGALGAHEAGRAAAYRTGDGPLPAGGYGPFSAAVTGVAGAPSGSYLGLPVIEQDPTHRSFRIRLERGVSFTSPAVSADYAIRAGAWSRMMQFFGGPPDPWE
jgi:hypothetical protein